MTLQPRILLAQEYLDQVQVLALASFHTLDKLAAETAEEFAFAASFVDFAAEPTFAVFAYTAVVLAAFVQWVVVHSSLARFAAARSLAELADFAESSADFACSVEFVVDYSAVAPERSGIAASVLHLVRSALGSEEFEMLTTLVGDFGLALFAFAEFVVFDSAKMHTAADSALAVYSVVERLHLRYSTFAE